MKKDIPGFIANRLQHALWREAIATVAVGVCDAETLGSERFIFRNAFADIARNYELLGPHGTRFEHECYDLGHLYNLAHFADKGVVKPPFFIQSVFGILDGIGADPDNVVFMRRTADRLFGSDYVWSVLAAGKHQMPTRGSSPRPPTRRAPRCS